MLQNKELSFAVEEIMGCQKNRYPMLFIDRVVACVPGKYAKGFKLFSYNEWYFHGYETQQPKVWNAIQVEAMSQMFLMTFLSKDEYRGEIAVSNKFDNVLFKKKIIPGDRLDLEAQLNSFKRGIAKGEVKGYVAGQLACSLECTIVLPSQFDSIKPPTHIDNSDKIQNKTSYQEIEFGIKQIQECLLNKYPWLLLDRVLEIEPGKNVTAIKNFTYNEHFFPTHFPEFPSVPGFIQIECCMQAFLLTFLSLDQFKRKETADLALNNVRVQRKIVPGDTLVIDAKLKSFSRGFAQGEVISFVDGEPAISFTVKAVILEELEKLRPQ